MEETFVLNPDEEEIYLFNIDDEGSNLPVHLKRGPYYESLEQIPIAQIFRERNWERERLAREQQFLQPSVQNPPEPSSPVASFLPASPRGQGYSFAQTGNPFQPPSPQMRLPSPSAPETFIPFPNSPREPSSPPLQRSPLGSPRGQLTPTGQFTPPRREFGFDDPPGSVQSVAEDAVVVRKWKVVQAIELKVIGDMVTRRNEQELEEFCTNQFLYRYQFTGKFRNEEGEIILCSPADVLYEYVGLYRFTKPYTVLTVRGLDLYSGGQRVGTFERPQAIPTIPGQFRNLPGDIQMKIASLLEPEDLVKFCNLSANNRRLCQDPVRSVWTAKLLQLNPATPLRFIRDPFRYFLRQYYGGRLLTFGSNQYNQLGRVIQPRTTFASLKPLPPKNEMTFLEALSRGYDMGLGHKLDLVPRDTGLDGIVDVSCSGQTTALVTTKGEVLLLGDVVNDVPSFPFQLGRDADQITIYRVAGVENALKVALTDANLAVLQRDGTVVFPGQRLPPLSGVADLASGPSHFVFLLITGEVITLGNNESGKLGRKEYSPTSTGIVPGISNAVKIAAGKNHTVVVLEDGRVLSFGANDSGQLGRITPIVTIQDRWARRRSYSEDPVPGEIPEFRTAVSVACGDEFTAVVLKDGRVATFGNNESAQLGRHPGPSKTPGPELLFGGIIADVIPKITNAVQVACGRSFLLVTLGNGSVLLYGSLDGYPEGPLLFKPTVLKGITSAFLVAAGPQHAAILVSSRGF